MSSASCQWRRRRATLRRLLQQSRWGLAVDLVGGNAALRRWLALELAAPALRADREGYECFNADGSTGECAWPDTALSDYALEMEAFSDAVAGDDWGRTTAISERRSLAVVMEGFDSVLRGERIRISAAYEL